LPAGLREAAFEQTNDHFCLKSEYKTMVEFRQQDVRTTMPDGFFYLILCRNLVFTYFDEALQENILAELLTKLLPGGWLVVGVRERLPETNDLVSVNARLGLYQKAASARNIY
jgi:chemotaxis protein methyltransferase CheR